MEIKPFWMFFISTIFNNKMKYCILQINLNVQQERPTV